MRINGPSESSSSAEGSAAVRASPRGEGAEPSAVRGNCAEDSAAERGSQQGVEPTAQHHKFVLLVLLLLEVEREDIQQQQGRRLFVRMPRVVLE